MNLLQEFPKVGQLVHTLRREQGYVDPIAEMEEIVFRLRDSAEIDGGLPLDELLLFLDGRFQVGDEAVDYLIASGFSGTLQPARLGSGAGLSVSAAVQLAVGG